MARFFTCLFGVILFQAYGVASELYSHPQFADPEVRSNSNFVKIKAGTFRMGSPSSEPGRHDNEVEHDVTISKDFEMQSTVVTQGQFFLAMGANPSYFKSKSYCKDDYVQINGADLCPNNPVESLSWNDAQDFIKKLNVTDKKYQYRLPTEAEWEYSARGGSQAAYYYGNDTEHLDDYVWYSNNSGEQTHAVGTKAGNAFGMYDAEGNVWQWVQDWYGEYSDSRQTDPVGAATGLHRVVRGGSWYNRGRDVRVATRHSVLPDYRFSVFGFRLVRTAR